MYLAEAIREKDYIQEIIDGLCDRIRELSVSADETDVKLNTELAKNKVKELENLYKEWQKYVIIIARAKVASRIKLNDEDFSIADAENILESMRDKLDFLEGLIIHLEAFNLAPQKFVCMDLEDIHSKVKNIKTDIRTIENSVERSLWNIEV
jgi:hypothetical protein